MKTQDEKGWSKHKGAAVQVIYPIPKLLVSYNFSREDEDF